MRLYARIAMSSRIACATFSEIWRPNVTVTTARSSVAGAKAELRRQPKPRQERHARRHIPDHLAENDREQEQDDEQQRADQIFFHVVSSFTGAVPVEPKPPSPRSVSPSSSTSRTGSAAVCVTTSWARRSPFSTMQGLVCEIIHADFDFSAVIAVDHADAVGQHKAAAHAEAAAREEQGHVGGTRQRDGDPGGESAPGRPQGWPAAAPGRRKDPAPRAGGRALRHHRALAQLFEFQFVHTVLPFPRRCRFLFYPTISESPRPFARGRFSRKAAAQHLAPLCFRLHRQACHAEVRPGDLARPVAQLERHAVENLAARPHAPDGEAHAAAVGQLGDMSVCLQFRQPFGPLAAGQARVSIRGRRPYTRRPRGSVPPRRAPLRKRQLKAQLPCPRGRTARKTRGRRCS